MKKSLVMLTVLTVTALLSAGNAWAYDVPVANQSFELVSPPPDGIDYWYGNGTLPIDPMAHDGDHVLLHNNGIASWDTFGIIGGHAITEVLAASTVYTISVWQYKPAGKTHAGGYLSAAVGEKGSFTTFYSEQTTIDPITVDDVWQERIVVLDTVAHPEYVGHYISYIIMNSAPGAADNECRWDDLTITAEVVPEPGSLVALGGCLIGLAGFAIRRRK